LKFANGTPGFDQLSEFCKSDHFSLSFSKVDITPERKIYYPG